MKKETTFKILKIFAAVLLSVALIFGAVAVSFYYSVIALTKPEMVTMFIQEVDYKKVIQKNPTIKNTLSKYGITPTEADTVMKSKQTAELVKVYTDEVTQIFLDIPQEKKLDVAYITELVKENTDEFLNIAEEKTELKFKREQTKREIDAFLQKNEVVIEESVAMIEEVRDVVKTIYTSRVIEEKLSLWFAIILVAATFIIIAGIIVLLRSNGFFCVGINFTLVGIILGVIILYAKSDFVTDLALKMSDFGTQIVESAVSVSVQKLIIAVFATSILAVLFNGFFAALKFLKYKYKNENPSLPEADTNIDPTI